MVDDIKYQIKYKIYEKDEIAWRFHHRLVWIHPFSNGNGRHARFVTDHLLATIGQPSFSWGQSRDDARKHYIDALKKADHGDYKELGKFVRS